MTRNLETQDREMMLWENAVEQRRTRFYPMLKREFPVNPSVYYVGARTDMLPAQKLGVPMIYGDIRYSQPEDFEEGFFASNSHVQFVADDITRSKFENSSFDLIISKNMFLNVLEKPQFVAEIDRLLKPQGIAVYEWEKSDLRKTNDLRVRDLIQTTMGRFWHLGYQRHELDMQFGEITEGSISSQLYRPGQELLAQEQARIKVVSPGVLDRSRHIIRVLKKP